MENSETKAKTGEEAILIIGQKLFPTFNLSDPVRRENYRKAYCCLTGADCPDINPAKGLLVTGNIGVGKSRMMDVMQRLFLETDRAFLKVKASALKDMLDYMTVSEIKERYGYQLQTNLYIDDFGVGISDTKRWGNVSNIIAEIIIERYELFTTTGLKTHLSSNLMTSGTAGGNTMRSMLGDRVMDRIIEMTNLIVWKGQSLRRNEL